MLRKHLMWLNPFVDRGSEVLREVMRCLSQYHLFKSQDGSIKLFYLKSGSSVPRSHEMRSLLTAYHQAPDKLSARSG